ncbi:hypothetical protein Taro_007423 [Colocasia esculenta]|uniref:Uncharacterized protein n=1 Tax=Colocasia esculenta TaxID=4460 RepID=A0A843TVD9_COLES|nr:hypothetical protein [Colocasia esculenta]
MAGGVVICWRDGSCGTSRVKQDHGRSDLVKLAASAGAVLSWRPCKAPCRAEVCGQLRWHDDERVRLVVRCRIWAGRSAEEWRLEVYKRTPRSSERGASPQSRGDDLGRVEELLVAEELWNDHKKLFFYPFSSAATCTNHSLEVNQSRVEELLVAEELWNGHKKLFFFPFSSAATCTNHSLEIDQRFYVERFV